VPHLALQGAIPLLRHKLYISVGVGIQVGGWATAHKYYSCSNILRL
jgi:hypothetical protein